jgi:hypothetical protein
VQQQQHKAQLEYFSIRSQYHINQAECHMYYHLTTLNYTHIHL